MTQAIPTNINWNFMFDELNDSNILLYAAKCYEKPNCLDSEFDEDYKKIRYIKRLLQRYRLTGEIKERLVLNHLVIAQNVFGVEPTTRMLFLRIDERDYSALKTLLLFTSSMPTIVRGIREKDIISSDIPIDFNLAGILRKL
jgi:hypothetical protein